MHEQLVRPAVVGREHDEANDQRDAEVAGPGGGAAGGVGAVEHEAGGDDHGEVVGCVGRYSVAMPRTESEGGQVVEEGAGSPIWPE